ncbi:nitroreductase family protein [Nitrosopumilus maritimus]|uniref:Nitroreductase n=1 Tax=Nitrosopumilus maritimus (strain SCM1) TaxID=436308 RepID=A9A2L4_NITMS|nr:nitroreductase family protein [Nitrosopumilus maritimus]ABX13253.1 nitroreductase [Nitrosopumilus maritimus SCM1]
MEQDNPKKIYPQGYEPKIKVDENPNIRNQLLNEILKASPTEVVDTDLFAVMAKRRSTRKFKKQIVETEKVDKIIAAADTAPTARNFQGFEIFYIKSPQKKKELIEACNKQPYVNAPLVLVFCKNPDRVKLDFPEHILKKFAIQDATLAAAYSQLAAQALGLSSIWIGMLDEQKVMDVIGTDLTPSSVLCIGYPEQVKFPKPRRNLKELVHVVWD